MLDAAAVGACAVWLVIVSEVVEACWVCFCVFLYLGGWVKIKLKLPHYHVSDTCRVSI